MRDIAEIAASVNRITNDIKAEVVAASLIENGLDPADIVMIHDGSFRRNYSGDIAYAETIISANDQVSLGIHVSRDGLYDCLPEAVFHEQPREPLVSGHDMAKLSKKQKMEEKEARLFFLPFENEIFTQRIRVESEERKMLCRFSDNLFDEIYPQFWKLDRTLPKKLVSRFVQVLHLAGKIVGRSDLTARVLEVILDEDVRIKVTTQNLLKNVQAAAGAASSPGLGACSLGNDMICGGYIADNDPVMEFVIGPLKNSAVEDYLENGPCSRFLACFYSYFVPLEMVATTTISFANVRHQFMLGEHGSNVILGYNAGI